MSAEYTLNVTQEQAQEMPMVDLAFLILKSANTPYYYRDLMNEIARIKGISEDAVMDVIAQLYTEINIDGRFACVGNNLWGLKRWYPVDKGEDSGHGTERPRIINDDDDDLDDVFEDEEDSDFSDDGFDEESDEEELYDEDIVDEVDDEVDEGLDEVDSELDEELEEFEEELVDDLDDEESDDELDEEDDNGDEFDDDDDDK